MTLTDIIRKTVCNGLLSLTLTIASIYATGCGGDESDEYTCESACLGYQRCDSDFGVWDTKENCVKTCQESWPQDIINCFSSADCNNVDCGKICETNKDCENYSLYHGGEWSCNPLYNDHHCERN